MVAAQQRPDGRSRIIAAARNLFASRGFHLTAMSELATEAQVSVGQIYRLFKNKDDIILAIVEDDHREWMVQMTQVRDAAVSGRISPAEAFERLILETLSDEYETLTFEILAEAGRSAGVGARIRQFAGDFRAVLRDLACRANDRLGERDLEAVTELLMATLFGLSGRNLGDHHLDREATASEIARLIMAMLKNAES